MTVFVCSLIVPARIASLTAATKASRSAVAGTSESRSTAAPGGDRHGGVHAGEQGAAVQPVLLALGVAVGGDVQVQRLAEPGHDLREAGGGVGVGPYGPHGADHELERGLHLGPDVLRRPEVGGVEDGAQHLADVAAGALPRCHGGVDTAVGWIVGRETGSQ